MIAVQATDEIGDRRFKISDSKKNLTSFEKEVQKLLKVGCP